MNVIDTKKDENLSTTNRLRSTYVDKRGERDSWVPLATSGDMTI